MNPQFNSISVRGVFKKGSEILVEWFAPKSISFLPGGTVESGEELFTALVREFNEELFKIQFSVGRYLGKIGHIWRTPSGVDSCLNHFFEIIWQDECHIKAKEAGREFRWLNLHSEEAKSLQPPSLAKLLLEEPDLLEWNVLDS